MAEAIEPNKFTILVVDDNSDNLTLMSGLLRDQYKVKVANSAERGLQIAQGDNQPDLILLDVMMPGMDGYEMCRLLKLDPWTQDIPVIFITAKWDVEDEQRGLDLGAVDYITKPFCPPLVLARVRNHLALKMAADFLREKNYFLAKEVRKCNEEIMGMKTGVFMREIDGEELNAIVVHLTRLLTDDDAEVGKYLEQHQALLEEAFHSDFKRLENAIRDYDFARALEILESASAQWQINW